MASRRQFASRVLRDVGPFRDPVVRRLVRAAFIGMSAAIGALAVAWATGGDPAFLPLAFLAGTAGGVLGSLIARALRPIGERFFGVTTNARLLELANPASPPMRRLMTEAPGTYMHSVVTSNLAAAAAEAIDAHVLLTRVGAYYHDIGKMKRPEFFFENLFGADNPHEGSSADLSTAIIISHVQDGLDLAAEYRLPKEIVDIIGEHHGTSVVRCFYRKAADADASVFESAFRYPSALPQTPESGLVMLADGCEAAVRAHLTGSDEEIASTVRKVVVDRHADGQLAESGLDDDDLEVVIGVYTRILVSMYHPRMEYPDDPVRSERADLHHEPSRPRTA